MAAGGDRARSLGERLGDDVVGGWCQLPSASTAEVMGSVGWDFVCVDTQHGLIGDDTLLPILRALDATGTPTLVRVATNAPEPIGRALDRGADGVIVPLVDSAEQARAAVNACHHPPRGTRSYGPTRVGWRAAATGAAPVCVVMIETRAGVAALGEIVAVEGLDAVFVGPSDLALAVGKPLDAQHGSDPEYDTLLGSIASRCREAGLPAGIYSASPAHVQRYRRLGFTFFAVMSDVSLLRAAAAARLAESRG
ncbi:HpcH/HpaI aldolase family protein [Pseudonocardia spinosispora]|uniref:HpcH/HpaI aldolase family protein n=1 Tax=Pseudonocardia spinosispora TaxID=103441 RepID=UPI0004061516|nr:aldolase/citrate lyase family protein [Pseudonocardia spinosispora]